MKQVAKVVIIDQDNQYLLLTRGAHPSFPDDPDLPGGTAEADETPAEALRREVREEAGIELQPDDVSEIYAGQEFSGSHEIYHLSMAHLKYQPKVKLSWEHTNYQWLSREAFIKEAGRAKDTYMQMVYSVLTSNPK